jgi:hypothetical protein
LTQDVLSFQRRLGITSGSAATIELIHVLVGVGFLVMATWSWLVRFT